jgi:hypothetical protein
LLAYTLQVMSPERFEIERSVITAAPRSEVMRLILDPSTWPDWQAEIRTSEGPTPLSPSDVVDGRARMLGFDVDGQSVTSHVTDESYEQSVVVGVGMKITYRLEATSEGTKIVHSLSSQLPAGAMGRLLSVFLARRLRKMQKELLRALKAQVEASSG